MYKNGPTTIRDKVLFQLKKKRKSSVSKITKKRLIHIATNFLAIQKMGDIYNFHDLTNCIRYYLISPHLSMTTLVELSFAHSTG